MKNSRLKNYCFNTLLTIALCAAYCIVGGLLGLFIGLLVSALLGVVAYKEHYGLGIANSLLILIILVLFLGPLQGLASGASVVLLGISLALGARFKLSVYQLLLVCTALFDLDIIFSVHLLGKLSEGEVSVSSMMLDMGQQFRDVLMGQNQDPAVLDMMEKMISSVIDVSIMLSPAFFTIFSILMSYGLILIFKKMMMKAQEDVSFLKPFNQLQCDRVIAVIFLVLCLLLSAAPEGMFFASCANVLLILCFLFFALGLAVFDYKLKAKGTGRAFRRVLIAALICCSTMFIMLPVIVLVLYGLSDAFFDYRHLRPVEPPKSGEV